MFPLFLIAWALGAWLVMLCVALIWAERIRIYLRLPACDKCGYSLEGLDLESPCPECNGTARRVKFITGTPTDAPVLIRAWLIPLVAAIVTAIAMSLVFEVPGAGAIALLALFILMALLLSLLIHSMARLLPPVAVHRITLFGCLAIVLAAAWFSLIVHGEGLARDLPLLAIMGAMVWPFCGYGLAGALLTVPAESWLRETLRRVRHAQTHRT